MTRVALITYDTSIHLYHFQPHLSTPTMMVTAFKSSKRYSCLKVLSDINQFEIPQGYPFLSSLKDIKDSLVQFLAKLPTIYADTKVVVVDCCC